MEDHFYRNLLIVCVGVWFLFFLDKHLSRTAGESLPAAPVPVAVEVVQPTSKVSPVEVRKQSRALEQDRRASEEKLTRLKIERNKRAEAAAKTSSFREAFQIKYQSAWTDLLAKNWQTYQELRPQARFTQDRTTPCTICNGRGKLTDPCFVCASSGKCPTCAGAGKLYVHDELCPTCLGANTCFFCGGSGRLNCPFCDDGQIYYDAKPPPIVMPVN